MIHMIHILWLHMIQRSQVAFTSRIGAGLFVLAKFLRFSFFLLFIVLIGERTKLLLGYSLQQMILFFLTYHLIDITAQLLLREVYRFRGHIVSGEFDFILLKPYPPLIRSLFGGSDILDLPMFFVIFIAIIVVGFSLPGVTIASVLSYLLLVVNGFVIALSFHILVVSLGVITTTVDQAIFIYRDLTQMARVPVDIYQEPLRSIITFLIPVGVMITFPAKAMMGLLSLPGIVIACCIGGLFLFVSLQCWKFALRQYSSASS